MPDGLCICMSWPCRADVDRDGRRSVEELLDVMNAGKLRLGAVLPALEATAGGAVVRSARTSSPGHSASWASPASRTARPSSPPPVARFSERCCSPTAVLALHGSTARGCRRAPQFGSNITM